MTHFPDRSRYHLAAWLVAACSSLAPAHAVVTPTLSTREDHGVVVREDGTLWTWGSNTGGQIGDGTFDTRWLPWQVGTSTNWKMAVAGTNSTHAIRADGTLWGWGANGFGQLGNGNNTASLTPIQIGTETSWSSLAAGSTHVLGIKSDGSLWAWGGNANGQLGIGSSAPTSTPTQVGVGTDWRKVAGGFAHTVAIRTPDAMTPCGTLWAWGFNTAGEVGDGTNTQRDAPVQVGSDSDWCSVAAGASFTLAVKSNGTLWSWGRNVNGQLGNGTTNPQVVPLQAGTDANWSQVSAGEEHSLGRKTDGTLWSWGGNAFATLGTGTLANSSSPVQIGSATTWSLVAAGSRHSYATQANGSLWSWGNESAGQMGDNGVRSRRSLAESVGGGAWSQFVPGRLHSLAIRSDGTLWGWGANSSGQVGDGTTVIRNAPVQIGTGNWLQVSASNSHSLGIRTDGTLWAWGANNFGQVGDGSGLARTAPVQIGSDTNWVAVAAGGITLNDIMFSHSVALRSDGTLWAWGYNAEGQLGDGTAFDRPTPVQVGSSTSWSGITAGGRHTIARKSDGTLWAWGRNDEGQIGDGTSTPRLAPVQIGTDTDWASASAGIEHSVARKTDGSVWSWGLNSRSQTDGTFALKLSPVRLGLGADWAQVAAAFSYSLFLRSDGTAWAAGENMDGQFGDGSRVHSRPPFSQVALFSDWTQVRASGSRSGGIRAGGTLWTWGRNDWGQLGIGVDTFTPANTSFSLLNGSAALSGANNSAMHDFGNVKVGNSANVILTLTAGGTITINSISATAPFSVSSTSCPLGLLNAGNSCTITTTFSPSTAGSNTGGLTIAADGPVANSPLTLIGYAPSAPVISSAASTTFTVLQASSFSVQTFGLPTPSLSLSGALPGGVSFTPSTGVLQGTPASGSAGSYPVTITSANAGGTTNQSFTLTVAKLSQAITFGAQGGQAFAPSATFAVSPTASASTGLPVVYSSLTPSVCTMPGTTSTTVTMVTAGTCTIAANQSGDANYGAAPQVTQDVAIAKASQTITFNTQTVSPMYSAGGTFVVTPAASATSGLGVIYTSTTPSVCTMPGTTSTTVTMVAAGTCTIAADQPGNVSYLAASQVTRDVTIAKGNQTITFGAQAGQPFVQGGQFPINPVATASSGLAVTHSSTTNGVCTVSGTTVTMVALGTCTLAANQAGNSNYNAAAQVTATVAIGTAPGAPTIGAATPGSGFATIAFTPPASDGGSAIIDYRATCNPGGFTQVGTASPITVTGLANGTAYTCSVTARNVVGTGAASGTVSVTPRVLQMVLNPPSIDFGGQSMRTTSPAAAITVTNNTASSVTVSSITATAQFGQSHNCGTLAPLASCQVQVTFSPAASGIALGAAAPVSGTLSVSSNASGSPHTAPLSGSGEKSLVTHYYRSILRRAPDPGGKAFWEGEGPRVANLGANVNEVWYSMAQTFYFSAEYAAFNRSNSAFVTDLFNTFFNRAPDSGGLNFWVGNLDQGMPREVALAEFMFSTEFRNFAQAIFGSTGVRAELDMIMDFYRGLLARLPDDAGFNFWVGRFRAAQCSASPSAAIVAEVEAISSAFALSGEYTARGRTSAQYVGDLYNAFLRRGGDLAGVQFWVGQVSTAAQTREQVRVQFKNSAEFQSRVSAVIATGCLP